MNAAGDYGIKRGVFYPLELHVDEIARLNLDKWAEVGGGGSRIDEIPTSIEHLLELLSILITTS